MLKFNVSNEHSKLIIDILRKNLPTNTTVWIFGSRLTSFVKKYSDLDLLIDCKGCKVSDIILVNLKEEFDESDLPYKVDLLDWHRISTEFKKNIKNKEVFVEL